MSSNPNPDTFMKDVEGTLDGYISSLQTVVKEVKKMNYYPNQLDRLYEKIAEMLKKVRTIEKQLEAAEKARLDLAAKAEKTADPKQLDKIKEKMDSLAAVIEELMKERSDLDSQLKEQVGRYTALVEGYNDNKLDDVLRRSQALPTTSAFSSSRAELAHKGSQEGLLDEFAQHGGADVPVVATMLDALNNLATTLRAIRNSKQFTLLRSKTSDTYKKFKDDLSAALLVTFDEDKLQYLKEKTPINETNLRDKTQLTLDEYINALKFRIANMSEDDMSKTMEHIEVLSKQKEKLVSIRNDLQKNTKLEELQQNNSNILTYIKIRCDNKQPNERFLIKRDLNYQQLYVGYMDVPRHVADGRDIALYDDNGKPMYKITKLGGDTQFTLTESQLSKINPSIDVYDNHYLYGPFTRVFPSYESNIKVASQCAEVLKSLKEGRSVFMFGYGASGAGKTSTLVYFNQGKTDEDKHGILIHILNRLAAESVKQRGGEPESQTNTPRTSKQEITLSVKELLASDTRDSINDYAFAFNKSTFTLKTKQTYKNEHNKSAEQQEFKEGTPIAEIIKHCIEDDRAVQATTNNPVSSRSHVMVFVRLDFMEQQPFLIIGDFAGVENAFDCGSNDVIEKMSRINKANNKELFYTLKKLDEDKCLVGKDKEKSDRTCNVDMIQDLTDKELKFIQKYEYRINNIFDITTEQMDSFIGSVERKDNITVRNAENERGEFRKVREAFDYLIGSRTQEEDKLKKNDNKFLYINTISEWKDDLKINNRRQYEQLNSGYDKDAKLNKEYEKYIIEQKNAFINKYPYLDLTLQDDRYKRHEKTFQYIVTMLGKYEPNVVSEYKAEKYHRNDNKDNEPRFSLESIDDDTRNTLRKMIEETEEQLGSAVQKAREEFDIASRNTNEELTKLRTIKSKVECNNRRNKNITLACGCRNVEGKFINDSLNDLRGEITKAVVASFKDNNDVVPPFNHNCFNMYCNPFLGYCFNDHQSVKQSGDNRITSTIKKVLNNKDQYEKMVYGIFCVMNWSRSANNPPPTAYIDVDDLRMELARAKEFARLNDLPLYEHHAKVISDALGVIVDIRDIPNIIKDVLGSNETINMRDKDLVNKLTEKLNDKPNKEAILKSFTYMIYQYLISENLQQFHATNDKYVNADIIYQVRNRLKDPRIPSNEKSAIEDKLKIIESYEINDVVDHIKEVIQMIEKINATSTLGTLEFTDMMAKYGMNQRTCRYSRHSVNKKQRAQDFYIQFATNNTIWKDPNAEIN
jgi:hypothetical protein